VASGAVRPRRRHTRVDVQVAMLAPFRKVRRALGPAVTAALVLLGLLFLVTVTVVYVAENGKSADFTSFRSALEWVAVTLVKDPPWHVVTPVGKVMGYVVEFLKPISVAVITAAVTTHLFQLIVRRGSGKGRTRLKDHIVICGWSGKAEEILREIRGRGDEGSHKPVVLLAKLEASPTKDELTTFISGDPTQASDLQRAGIERAETAIVLADNSYPDIDAEEMDSHTLLTTLAIESLNPSCYTCVEVVHSANRDHFNRTKADELVVSAHLTGALLAHSAIARGLSRIVDDLLTYPEGDEFYWAEVPATWAGRPFRDALTALKVQFDCLPLAVGRDGSYTTNPPADYVLQQGDRLLVLSKDDPALT
jgi:voltage-gated potassium channel